MADGPDQVLTYPLSPLQWGAWWQHRLDADDPRYRTGMPFRLIGEMSDEWLKAWWRSVPERHPAMRTTFGEHAGAPRQTVRRDGDLPIVEHDVRGASEHEIAGRILAVHRSPQPLERESPYSLHVFTRGANDRTVLMRSHHIIVDLASEDTLFADLRDHLARARAGAPVSELAGPPRTYAEFVTRHQQQLDGEAGARHARFWEEALAGAPTLLEMPGDRPRTSRGAPRGSSFGFELLDAAGTARLHALCAATRTSPFRALLAAYLAFLYRHTGQDDMLVGAPADCRGADFEGVVGNFVNLMVIRGRASGAVPFRELLARTGDAVRSAAAHRDYPFPMLLDRVVRQRQPGRSPLVQTSFNLTRLRQCPELEGILWPPPGPRWRGELAGLGIESGEPVPQQEGHFELGLTAVEVGTRLVGELKYDAEIFDRETIERFATRMTALLASALGDPDRRVDDLSMMPDAERELVQVTWNATEQPFTSTVCHALIEEQVDRTPDAVALRHAGESLTYREMDDRANRLAHRLQRLGVGADTLVGIYLPRSCDVVVVMLAVLKAGGAYVPLDLGSPADRLALILGDAAPSLVVTSRGVEAGLPSGVRRLVLDAEAASIEVESASRPTSAARDRSLAYVIYTSGSTGTPKGVLIEHRGLCNLAESLARIWELGASSCLYCYASFGFDASVADIFPSLVSGSTLHLGSGGGPLAGGELHAFMRDAGITHVTLTPAVWASMPSSPLPALRVAVSAGEACIAETVAIWGKGRSFFNNYGPTEITVCATVGECAHAENAAAIGRPLANLRTYVLDERMQPLAIGVPGELYLGGVGVARGYLNRPELTESRFLADPFVPDARVYRTGDIARWKADGTLEYLGRRDTQVKLRGHRIELGEIESLLRQQPGVVDACAVVHDAAADRRILVAYVTRAPEPSPDADGLRGALARSLPDYMVPARIFLVDDLPLTVSGKVDRDALARRELEPHASDRRTPPVTPREIEIAAVWARLLRLQGAAPLVAREDDFFALGGDSLLALVLAHEIGELTGTSIVPSLLPSAPTLEAFCRALEGSHDRDGAAGTGFVDLRPVASSEASSALYFFPPAGGDASVYASLAERLSPRLRPLGAAAVAPLGSIADLARAYATRIEQTAGETAVSLAGWSMGGVLAMSVAHELEARGRRVAFVALLDSRLPRASGPSLAPSFFAALPDLDVAGEALAALPPAELERVGAKLLELPAEQRAAAAAAIAVERSLTAGGTRVSPASFTARLRAHARALEEHEASVVSADLIVMWSRHTVEIEATTPWARFTRGRAIERVVGGHHYALLRAPVVDEVASALASALAEAIPR